MRFFVLSFCLTLSILVFAQNSLQTLNSPFDEQNAVLSPDGRTLYLTIANHPQNVGGKRDPGDIWISTWTNGQWSPPTHGGTVINDRGYNGVAGFNADGSQLFLLSHYAAKTQGISVSRAAGSGWSRPENIKIPYFQNKSNMVSGYLSSDGKVFVFSAESYGSYGVEDIFVSLKDDAGKWSPPKNLGGTINSQFQELSPSLSDDGKTLYFSTNGKGGLGSFDIFKATRLDDSWTRWSEPVNLGPNVNTSGRDLYYRFYQSNGTAFYTSTLNSDGYGDVRMVAPGDYTLPEQTPIIEEQEENIAEPVASTPEGVRVFGTVTDSRTGERIPATLTFTDESGERAIAAGETGYEFLATPPTSYRVVLTAPGYISTMEKLDVTDLSQHSLEMNFRMQPVERGTTVNLKNVLFEQSKTDLLPESYAELDVVVEFLKNNPTVTIELAGHTDNRGQPSANLELSRARVEKVKAYLVSKGISEKRITGKGYGGSHPIASNGTEETRKLNRRVEFTIKRF
jgi:outer membrane protein OmpA-like peptidoglycan-associated protein